MADQKSTAFGRTSQGDLVSQAWHMQPQAGLALLGRQITLIVKAVGVLSP
ncbi:hypothetical protein ACTHSJ_14810 [Paenibacillus cellulositrophicus]